MKQEWTPINQSAGAMLNQACVDLDFPPLYVFHINELRPRLIERREYPKRSRHGANWLDKQVFQNPCGAALLKNGVVRQAHGRDGERLVGYYIYMGEMGDGGLFGDMSPSRIIVIPTKKKLEKDRETKERRRKWRKHIPRLIAHQCGACPICGFPLPMMERGVEVDHLTPLNPPKGQPKGEDWYGNIAAAHTYCNALKSDNPMADARAEFNAKSLDGFSVNETVAKAAEAAARALTAQDFPSSIRRLK